MLMPSTARVQTCADAAYERLLNSGLGARPGGEHFHPKFGHLLSPNQVREARSDGIPYTLRTNSLGFRTRELEPRRRGEYRVVLLGDSMFFGVGVDDEEVLSVRLEELAGEHERGAPPLRVYNYSVTGYNTVQELLVARSFLERARPDHVILGFLTANDLVPNALTEIDAAGDYALREDRVKSLRLEVEGSLSRCMGSALCRAFVVSLWMPRLRYQVSARPEIIRESVALLERVRDECRTLEARFSVVLIHPRSALRRGPLEAWTQSRRVGRMLSEACRARGIEVLDLLELPRGTRSSEHWFLTDGHFSAEGHADLARLILERLVMAEPEGGEGAR